MMKWRCSGSTILLKVTVNFTGTHLPTSQSLTAIRIIPSTQTSSDITPARMSSTRPEIPSAPSPRVPAELPNVSNEEWQNILMSNHIFGVYCSLMIPAFVTCDTNAESPVKHITCSAEYKVECLIGTTTIHIWVRLCSLGVVSEKCPI